MSFLTMLLLWAAFSIVSILLRPTIKNKTGPGDFRPPEPREGQPIPVVFGTVLISPSITWFGDVFAKSATKEVTQLFGLISESIPLGYDYYAGMQLLLCHGPVDALLDIYIGEKRLYHVPKFTTEGGAIEPPQGWTPPVTPTLPIPYDENGSPTRVSVYLPKLFGGKDEGGGITGQFDMHWGSLTQGPSDYLAAFWGSDITPHYRTLSYVVLRRMNLGRSPTPQPWKFSVRKIPDGLGQSAYATITDEDGNLVANASEVIYSVLTDKVWGLGKRESDIDKATFQAVAQTLYSEGLGYSGSFDSRGEAWQLIAEVLRHIDGVVYQDPLSGKIALKLIRNDYTLGALVELDETNSVIDQFTRGSWAETVNESQVQFTDIARRFADGVAQAQNLAAIQAMDGEIVSNAYDLKGLGTHEAAQLFAERRNRSTSIPLNRFRIRSNRIAYAFHPGKPFKVTNADYGISEMVCRVVSVDYGSLVKGEMEIEAVQDVWDLSTRAYASPDDLNPLDPCGPLALIVTGYDPATDPTAVYGPGYAKLFEAPYWHNTTGGRALLAVSRASNSDSYIEVYRAIHGTSREKMIDPQYFIATGLLDDELAQIDVSLKGVSFTVRNAGDMEDLTSTTYAGMLAGERLMMIGDEILSWQTIEDLGDGQYRISGVWRGQLDTVPEFHPQSGRVFFYYNSAGANSAVDLTSPDDITAFSSIQVWPVRVSVDGTSSGVDGADALSILLKERVDAPYPPGDVRLDGDGYDAWPDETTGDVTLSWVHRARTGQSQMVAQDDSQPYTQEGTLTIEVLLDGVSVREWTGVTASSQAYTYANRTSDDADLTKRVEFRITPIGSGSEVGTVRITPSFLMQSS